MIIMKVVSKYRSKIALTMACYMVLVVISSISPLYLTRLVDELSKYQAANIITLRTSIFFVLSASALNIALGFFLTRHLGRMSLAIAAELRSSLIDNYLSSPRQHVPDAGDFLTVASRDTQRVVSFVTGDLNNIFVSIATFIGVSVVLANMNLALYAIIVLFIPFYLFVYKGFANIRYKLSLDIRNKHAILSDRMAASAKHQRTIYLHRCQAFIKGLLLDRIHDCNEAEFRSIVNNSWAGLSLSGISFLMSTVSFVLGTILVLRGRVTLGMLLSFTMYSGNLLSPVSSMTGIALSWQETRVAISNISRYRELKDSQIDCRREPLEIAWVSFEQAQFHKGNFDLTYQMRIAPVTSIVGLTGAGKSTICECLAGYITPTIGMVLYGTCDGDHISPLHMRGKVLLMDSHMRLFEEEPISLNLTLGAQISDAFINKTLEVVEMRAVLLERGVDLSRTVKEAGFSQGETQRLLIARALLRKPNILILDEALSGVHPALCTRIIRKLSELVPRTIIVSHRLSDHAQSDVAYCVEAGKVCPISVGEWVSV
ncbi:MAG: ABC transporter ATP-binding protein [Peptococcaceae bacterium]|nr:ABC transporter ATP-binding protein [Peptococcaceae bacterium]